MSKRVQKRRVEALRRLILQYGTQAALAEACMMDPCYISQMLNGHRPMGERTARRLERELGLEPLSMDQLDRAPKPMPRTADGGVADSQLRLAPFIAWQSIRAWLLRGWQHIEGSAAVWETPSDVGPRAFWAPMYDCSMTSHQGLSVPEGYMILVDPDVEPVPGRLVVALVGSGESMTFRQLVAEPGGRYLRPLNPAFRIGLLDEADSLVGVAVEARLRFQPLKAMDCPCVSR